MHAVLCKDTQRCLCPKYRSSFHESLGMRDLLYAYQSRTTDYAREWILMGILSCAGFHADCNLESLSVAIGRLLNEGELPWLMQTQVRDFKGNPILRRFISHLPAELHAYILSFIREPEDVRNAGEVSALWYTLLKDQARCVFKNLICVVLLTFHTAWTF